MGYALFAQRKLVLDSQLNYVELMMTQRSNEQYQLATNTLSLQQQLSSLNAAQSSELADLYEQLAKAGTEGDSAEDRAEKREVINDAIKTREKEFQQEIDDINREIYQVEAKENILEMEVKRLETMASALQKQLEAVEQAEGDAIDRATPKFGGA